MFTNVRLSSVSTASGTGMEVWDGGYAKVVETAYIYRNILMEPRQENGGGGLGWSIEKATQMAIQQYCVTEDELEVFDILAARTGIN